MPRHIKTQSSKQGEKPAALLLGAGYCARALIPHLQQRGLDIIATTRSPEKAEALSKRGAQALIHKGEIGQSLRAAMARADIIISSIPPNEKGDPVLQNLAHSAKALMPRARWVGYLSATSVYGDRKGQWAFEDELIFPVTQRGKNRSLAELQWLETGLPTHVFRLAGIYGPGRNPFARLRASTARAVIKEGHIVNRIHVEDIARAVLASIDKPNPVRVYNIADNHPAPPQDVLDFAAKLISAPLPKRISHESAEISDMARSFYVETKRISNARARAELGWRPLYGSYKQGLAATLKAESSR